MAWQTPLSELEDKNWWQSLRPRERNEARRMNFVRFEMESRCLTNGHELRWPSLRACSSVPNTKCNAGLWQGNIIMVIVTITGGRAVGLWRSHSKESLLQGVMCTRRWGSGTLFISNYVGAWWSRLKRWRQPHTSL